MNKEMKRNSVFITLLFFSFTLLFAAPDSDFHKRGHKNFHGKRMMKEDGEFRLLYVRAAAVPGYYNFGVVFSQPVNPDSITSDNFLMNGNIIPLENIRFSKNYRTVDFFVKADALILPGRNNTAYDNTRLNEQIEPDELIIKDIESISGKKTEPVVIKNFQINKEYRMMKKKPQLPE